MRKLFAFLTFLGCLPISAQNAPAFIQGTYSNAEWGGGPNTYSSITGTFNSNTTAGNTIIAVVQNDYHASVTGCTDT